MNIQHFLQMEQFTEEEILDFLSKCMTVSAIVTYCSLTFLGVRASYGRYSSDSYLSKVAVPARIAWFLQELPSLIIPIIAIWTVFFNHSPISFGSNNIIILGMFIGHYANRSLIYPCLINGGKPTPLHLFILGIIFCTWNGYIQGFYHAKYVNYTENHFWNIRSILGIALFFIGVYINVSSDRILRNLRKLGENDYKIPFGGMFELVSGANFFGEIIEWIGYATFARTHTAWAFSMFTIANTVPRAIQHHKWYHEHFKNYPQQRKAVFPYLL